MLTNYHTHSTFCDGKNTPEEIVEFAIGKGYSAIGLSGHSTTPFDLSYCMKDEEGYKAEIRRLKTEYAKEIQIYLGIEEDSNALVEFRGDFDYILGSSHYIYYNGVHYSVDSSTEDFSELLNVFGGDFVKVAEVYYEAFCSYILKRKPDIVGHFDLITKFEDALELGIFENENYRKISERYIDIALTSDLIFEVNTGGMAKGYRKTPYPHENLLYLIKKRGGKVMINSDCHFVSGLDFSFSEIKKMLRDIGFQYTYILYDNEFKKEYI